MGIVSMVVGGLTSGLLAQAIVPVRTRVGWIRSALLGLAGSFLGGFVTYLLIHNRSETTIWEFEPTTFFGSIFGALLVLAILKLTRPELSVDGAPDAPAP